MVVAIKKKRVSKKTKSSWRKHVDINDVDEFLEEQRFEERMGQPLSLLEDKDLFVIDTSSSNEQKLTPKQLKRQRLREAPLKCLSLLKPFTNVPDPIAKRNHVRTKEERKSAILKKKEALNKARGIFKKKDLDAVKNMKLDAERRQKNENAKVDLNKNIWEETKETPMEAKIKECEWITGDTERQLLYGTGKPQKNVPKLITQKLSALSSIEPPHPGMSYNPSLKDHQDLLLEVVEREKKIIKEEEHIKRVTTDMFKKVTRAERDSSWLVEMSQGISIPGQIVATEEEEDGEEYKAVNPPTENKKKSLKQRRKQKEQLKLEEERRKKKIEKKKITDILKLRLINKSIEKIEKKRVELFEKKLSKKEKKKKEAKRLANLKFEEPDLEFNMKQDITGSLRNIKTEGNILSDRFKSMQKRNILEPTVKQRKKKSKVKKFVKPGHKEDWKTTVARPGFLPKK